MRPVMPVWLKAALHFSAGRNSSLFSRLKHVTAKRSGREKCSSENWSSAVRSDSHVSVAFFIASVT